jgi:peptidoglycan hydrolase CwlO-like protein
MKNTFPLFLIPLLILSCGPSAKEKEARTEIIEKSQNAAQKVDNSQRKLIKEGSIKFKTGDIEETNDFINASIKKYDAFISKEEKFSYNNTVGYDLTIRVPSVKFDSLLNFILKNKCIKDLDTKNTQLQDVTEEFVDIQARLKVKKESVQKLLDLLNRAKNVTEILEINKQLTDIQSDIESIEGRLKYLNDQINFSTINLSFYENIRYSERFFKDFWEAFKDGWQVFLYVVTLLAYLWVIILVVIVIICGIKWYKKRKPKYL